MPTFEFTAFVSQGVDWLEAHRLAYAGLVAVAGFVTGQLLRRMMIRVVIWREFSKSDAAYRDTHRLELEAVAMAAQMAESKRIHQALKGGHRGAR